MFWLRNKKNNFLLGTLIWGPGNNTEGDYKALSPYVSLPVLYVQQIYTKGVYYARRLIRTDRTLVLIQNQSHLSAPGVCVCRGGGGGVL